MTEPETLDEKIDRFEAGETIDRPASTAVDFERSDSEWKPELTVILPRYMRRRAQILFAVSASFVAFMFCAMGFARYQMSRIDGGPPVLIDLVIAAITVILLALGVYLYDQTLGVRELSVDWDELSVRPWLLSRWRGRVIPVDDIETVGLGRGRGHQTSIRIETADGELEFGHYAPPDTVVWLASEIRSFIEARRDNE